CACAGCLAPDGATLIPIGQKFKLVSEERRGEGCEDTCLCLGPNLHHCVPSDNPNCKGAQSSKGASSTPRAPPLQAATCLHNSVLLTVGNKTFDGCETFCECQSTGEMVCAPIECPKDFALEYLYPDCYAWGPDPSAVIAPPNCCPEQVCINNGTCVYESQLFQNFDPIPTSLTGCEKRCSCEFGYIQCATICESVPKTPPKDLPCPGKFAKLTLKKGDDCCKEWTCP
ncbi:unnamed protein product, partial [Cyprideis torosa]